MNRIGMWGNDRHPAESSRRSGNLTGVDLSNRDLKKGRLQRADLFRSNPIGVDPSHANLADVCSWYADLTDANLISSSFHSENPNIHCTMLLGRSLEQAVLSGFRRHGGANLSGTGGA